MGLQQSLKFNKYMLVQLKNMNLTVITPMANKIQQKKIKILKCFLECLWLS